MGEEREVLGLAHDRDGIWVRIGGEVRFEPTPDPLPAIRREVFEAQRRWAEKNLRAVGVGPSDLTDQGGEPWVCRSCGSGFTSAGGKIVGGTCPNGRPTCPLEPA